MTASNDIPVIKTLTNNCSYTSTLIGRGLAFDGASHTGITLDRCAVEGTKIISSLWDMMQMLQGYFDHVSFSDTHLESCVFRGCDFHEVHFYESSIDEGKFTNQQWYKCEIKEDTIFTETVFENVIFTDCNLRKARFENCKFTNVKFVNCIFDAERMQSVVGPEPANLVRFIKCLFTNTELIKCAIKGRMDKWGKIPTSITDKYSTVFISSDVAGLTFSDCFQEGLDRNNLSKALFKMNGAEHVYTTPVVRPVSTAGITPTTTSTPAATTPAPAAVTTPTPASTTVKGYVDDDEYEGYGEVYGGYYYMAPAKDEHKPEKSAKRAYLFATTGAWAYDSGAQP